MNIIKGQIHSQYLLKIKKNIDSDKKGNNYINDITKNKIEYIREYGLNNEDIKDIIRQLSVEDCFSGPEADRDLQYQGWIFKFAPIYEGSKLYIKIRVENIDKAVCISVHEFGKYDGGK